MRFTQRLHISTIISSLLLSTFAQADVTFVVTNGNDTSTKASLKDAIDLANQSVGSKITITPTNGETSYVVPSNLSVITQDMTIQGPQGTFFTIDGQNQSSLFHVYKGNVSLNNMTIKNGLSQGGKGGNGGSSDSTPGGAGGGGGLGAGGGLFVNEGATVTLDDVNFNSNTARGGNGGNGGDVGTNLGGYGNASSGGGGGMLGGNGGNGTNSSPMIDQYGSGGGGGLGGNGGNAGYRNAPVVTAPENGQAGLLVGGSGGSGVSNVQAGQANPSVGGANSGGGGGGYGTAGGGNANGGGGGGGLNGTSAQGQLTMVPQAPGAPLFIGTAGQGGYGGGGGGGHVNDLSLSYLAGGDAGFGGGSGGTTNTQNIDAIGDSILTLQAPQVLLGGGKGGYGNGAPGDGGSGFGGAVYNRGTLIYKAGTVISNKIIEGQGGTRGTGSPVVNQGGTGVAFGSGLFLTPTSKTTFDVSNGDVIKVINDIGNGGFATGEAPALLEKIGKGNLELIGENNVNFTTSNGQTSLQGSLADVVITGNANRTTVGSFSAINSMINSLNNDGVLSLNTSGASITTSRYTQTPNGVLQVTLFKDKNPQKLTVNGPVSLAGTIQVNPESGAIVAQSGKSFTIIKSTQQIQNKFNTTILGSNASTISYNGTQVILNVQADSITPTNPSGTITSNQPLSPLTQGVATLTTLIAGSVSGGIVVATANGYGKYGSSDSCDTCTNTPLIARFSPQRLRTFYALTENRTPGHFSFSDHKLNLNQASSQSSTPIFHDPSGLGKGNMPTRQRVSNGIYSIWMSTLGQWISTKTTSQEVGIKGRSIGASFGGDLKVNNNLYLGAFGGTIQSRFDWKQDRGKGSIGSYFAGLYGRWNMQNGFYLDGKFFGGPNRYHNHRNNYINLTKKIADAKYSGYFLHSNLETGYTLALETVKIRPFLNVGHTFFHSSDFTEKDAGINNLHFKKAHAHILRTELASVFSRTFATNEILLEPSLKLGWTHRQSLGKRSQESQFAPVGQSEFTTQKTIGKYQDNFSSAIALTAQFENGAYIMGDVSGEVGKQEKSLEVLLRVGYDF